MFDWGHATSALIEVAEALLVIAVLVAAIEGLLYLVLVRWLKARLAVPIMLLAPAVVGLLALNSSPAAAACTTATSRNSMASSTPHATLASGSLT